MATAKAKVAGAGAMLRPVSSGTQVVMRRAQSMLTRPALSLSSWSCMGPRRRANATQPNSEHQIDSSEAASDPLVVTTSSNSMSEEAECSSYDATSASLGATDLDECEDPEDIETRQERMTEAELWQQLEHDLYNEDSSELPEEEADVAKEIKEEEEAVIAEAGVAQPEIRTPEMKESHKFLPPGKIMHIVTVRPEAVEANEEEDALERTETVETVEEGRVGIFLTPRSLYSKVRLSQRMISDHFMPVYRRQLEKLIQELTLEQEQP